MTALLWSRLVFPGGAFARRCRKAPTGGKTLMSARSAAVRRPLLAGMTAMLTLAGALGAFPPGVAHADSAPVTPAEATTPTTVTADALPTVQINGVAWAQVVVG